MKADAGYRAEVKDSTGKVRAKTIGQITLEVSAIGQSPVKLP